MASTLLYSIFSKKLITDISKESKSFILNTMPNLYAEYVDNNLTLNTTTILGGKREVYVIHFWGSWCGPCEAEFPELIEFAKKLKDSNVDFILIAVNDEIVSIKKFLKRFGELPSNIQIAIDNSGQSMKNFGTIKVPETYFFDKRGSSISKYIGPQDWSNPYFLSQITKFTNI